MSRRAVRMMRAGLCQSCQRSRLGRALARGALQAEQLEPSDEISGPADLGAKLGWLPDRRRGTASAPIS